MVNRKSFYLMLTALISLSASMVANAAFTASVNRTSLASHETLELTLRTDESSSDAPDLKPLEWSFDILGTRQQNKTSIINGKREFTRDWVVTLAPKQQGTLVIPPHPTG
ncbi:BatD family protein [Endozoicomonas sp. GU-1]|uniref:BatD family protein n=1 Tax=Endozoicomonas sp. GU-1 TaxID=3009078 RepID=UPI0022B55C49|nr:BatD family protein [Endozoicomonas sp. GU-1]WBA86259.1 BatD family protein [Endozoicomonas sp. GU-1]